MTDQELIDKGRECLKIVERSQMRLGELVLEYAPIGEASRKTGAYDRLQEYADKIGADPGTIRNYRAVAHAWKGIDHRGLNFSILKRLQSVGDKEKLIDALDAEKPPTTSGRWTADSAEQFAREHNLWTHSRAPGAGPQALDIIAALVRVNESLRTMLDKEYDPEAKERLVEVLDEFSETIREVREKLAQKDEVPVGESV